ncbi:MAG: tyrosine-type recombinase/integrase [Bacteroidetes bacterium]|nr:tyrosine-type recombinase/integrase [Bacteroidota bacterium]
MASLFKKRGLWHIAYFIDGKREYKNTYLTAKSSTKKEALKLKTEIEEIISSKNYIVNKKSLNSVCEKFIAEHMNLKSESHQSNFNSCMKHFYKVVAPDINVDEITSVQIAQFITSLVSSVSNATVLTYLSYLKMLFNYLLEEDLILKNPIKKKQIPVRERKNIIFFSDEILNKILDFAKSRDKKYYFYLKMLLLTGQRPQDVLMLKRANFNLEVKTLLINVSKTKSQINFPIYDELMKFITNELTYFKNLKSDEFLFGEFNGEIVHKRFQRLKASLQLKGESNVYTLKTFRKTFASKLASKGVESSKIANLLGHQDPKITMKYYSAISTDSLRKDIDEALTE